MAEPSDLVDACLIGAAGGMRSFAPVAALSFRGLANLGGPFRFVAGGAAGGELIADKQPGMASRLAPRGLGLRFVISGGAGAALAGPAGIPIAAGTAMASAYVCSHARVALAERFGRGVLWGVVEDVLAASLAAAATR
jgi:hypothetical protein